MTKNGWERSEWVTGFQDISHRAPKKQTLALKSISEASLSERFWGSKNLFLYQAEGEVSAEAMQGDKACDV